MFSSALKSFSANISSNYTLSPSPSTYSGPWKIYDAKKKSTGKQASVFVFERKALEPPGGSSATMGGRTNATSVKKGHEDIVDRLKREANSLARLRHPNVLELVEPIEETRGGGLMFATEPVATSLSQLLRELDVEDRTGQKNSRFVKTDEDSDQRQLDLDDLEIRKGLLQVAKALAFLHDSAGLIHANLTPDAIFINNKSDWKLSGLGFSTPSSRETRADSAMNLSEMLYFDPRFPKFVQFEFDFAAPEVIIDGTMTPASDLYSLGLMTVAIFNKPRKSPIESHASVSSYKRIFASRSSQPSAHNDFLASQKLPRDVASDLLPRLLERNPSVRIRASELEKSAYFDSILVSTIRFLDDLPAKSPHEKSQFLRGMPRMISQFPESVLERKILPAVLSETKDRDLLSVCLQVAFAIVKNISSARRAFTQLALPVLQEIFLKNQGRNAPADKDNLTAGLMVILDNLQTAGDSCTGKDFRDVLLPIVALALQSQTFALNEAALKTVNIMINILDFSTIKNELFPLIAQTFSKTTSLVIKVLGLEALRVLAGGPAESVEFDEFGLEKTVSTKPSSVTLDKFTCQEKVLPLLKAIKTKEPAVMMAALSVFTQLGNILDADCVAVEVMPLLWKFALGPLLSLDQFQQYMTLIKDLSSKIEQEHSRRLQELSTSNGGLSHRTKLTNTSGRSTPSNVDPEDSQVSFENLVRGRPTAANGNDSMENSFSSLNMTDSSSSRQTTKTSTWASLQPDTLSPPLQPSAPRTASNTLSAFSVLQPSPSSTGPNTFASSSMRSSPATTPGINTSQQNAPFSNMSSMASMSNAMSNPYSAFNIQPPTMQQQAMQPRTRSTFASPPASSSMGFQSKPLQPQQQQQKPQGQGMGQKQGLDKYESLI